MGLSSFLRPLLCEVIDLCMMYLTLIKLFLSLLSRELSLKPLMNVPNGMTPAINAFTLLVKITLLSAGNRNCYTTLTLPSIFSPF